MLLGVCIEELRIGKLNRILKLPQARFLETLLPMRKTERACYPEIEI